MSFKTFLNMNASSPFNCTSNCDCCILKSKKINTPVEFSYFFNCVVDVNFSFYHSIHVDVWCNRIWIVDILFNEIKHCFKHSANHVVGDNNLLNNVFNLNIRFSLRTNDSFIISSNSTGFWVYFLLARY